MAFWPHKFSGLQLKYSWRQGTSLHFHGLDRVPHHSLGAKLYIPTNHLNITTNNTMIMSFVIYWLNYVEQSNPYIHFITGKGSVIADKLLWFDHLDETVLTKEKNILTSTIPFQ